jgi:polynucleotide 5'-hydroxyl-kinase GRC3/NOL9
MEITPEAQWEALLKKLLRRAGTIMLLGESDSGKSTLARYLMEQLLKRKLKVAFVDSDIGQSCLGLPGTISMRVFNTPRDLADFTPERLFFIGSLSPAYVIPMMIDGTRKMVDVSRAGGAEAVVVDTTGLVSGEVGRGLKTGKVRAIRPDHIVAIQRGEELEPLLTLIKGPKVLRLKASKHARKRSRLARIAYREGKFSAYLKGARTAALKEREAEFLFRGKPVELKEIEPGSLVGLNRDGETAAVGVFLGLRDGKALIKTPLRTLKGINRVLIGEIIAAKPQ